MDPKRIPTITQMAAFSSGTEQLKLQCADKQELYTYVTNVCVAVAYIKLSKKDKGVVRHYLTHISGYSLAQVTRLIGKYVQSGTVAPQRRTQPTFSATYTTADIAELSRIDDAHENLSGPATIRIMKREYELFGNKACERLRNISSSHLYRLRGTDTYQRIGIHYTKTKPTVVRIGERTKPRSDGKPGYLRVDSVHQGDKDGQKGVYHINLVDEVTQWEVVVAVEGLSERFMLPALALAMRLFPFVIHGFHSDNGSEYINKLVAELLKRLHVKLTKSRPRHSGDNGLAETKNGGVLRKSMGYLHIPRTPENVTAINRWYSAWFVPYLNFHRPCGFRKTTIDTKTGKRTHQYLHEDYQTPYEKLKSLKDSSQYLRAGLCFDQLDCQAYAMSDTQWAETMREHKQAMWASLKLT